MSKRTGWIIVIAVIILFIALSLTGCSLPKPVVTVDIFQLLAIGLVALALIMWGLIALVQYVLKQLMNRHDKNTPH